MNVIPFTQWEPWHGIEWHIVMITLAVEHVLCAIGFVASVVRR